MTCFNTRGQDLRQTVMSIPVDLNTAGGDHQRLEQPPMLYMNPQVLYMGTATITDDGVPTNDDGNGSASGGTDATTFDWTAVDDVDECESWTRSTTYPTPRRQVSR